MFGVSVRVCGATTGRDKILCMRRFGHYHLTLPPSGWWNRRCRMLHINSIVSSNNKQTVVIRERYIWIGYILGQRVSREHVCVCQYSRNKSITSSMTFNLAYVCVCTHVLDTCFVGGMWEVIVLALDEKKWKKKKTGNTISIVHWWSSSRRKLYMSWLGWPQLLAQNKISFTLYFFLG